MDALRRCHEALGLTRVRTYGRSGNVVERQAEVSVGVERPDKELYEQDLLLGQFLF